MNKLSLTVLLIFTLLLTGCEKDENNFVSNAISDVYVKAIKHEGKIKYALVARTFANFTIESANVSTPDNKTIELSKRNDSPNFFDNYTDDINAYSETIPVKGEYLFTTKTEDKIDISRINILSEEIADFPIISSFELKDGIFNISWDKSEDTDFYIINLCSKDNEIIYSNEFINNVETMSINKNSKGWYTDRNLNDVFSVKLMAAKFDNKANPSLYLIQSITETSINIE